MGAEIFKSILPLIGSGSDARVNRERKSLLQHESHEPLAVFILNQITPFNIYFFWTGGVRHLACEPMGLWEPAQSIK